MIVAPLQKRRGEKKAQHAERLRRWALNHPNHPKHQAAMSRANRHDEVAAGRKDRKAAKKAAKGQGR